jgi:toxin-antitoxin system PIN domain toxin
MTSWLLPDVNVWVAMHHQRHAHHNAAQAWYDGLNEPLLVFCRQTQLGFFRILTTLTVMGNETLTQRQCWTIYEKWLAGGFAIEQPEPLDIGPAFRNRTFAAEPAPKTWMDAYLAAFAETAGLTLVTFDRALAGKAKGAVLLGKS